MPQIEARAVSKRFRQHKRFPGFLGALKTLVTAEYTEVTAVADVSFDIAAGEAVGYLGPNGAGKSTMIKMMTGILVPTGGTVSVLGRTPHESRDRDPGGAQALDERRADEARRPADDDLPEPRRAPAVRRGGFRQASPRA